MKKRVVGYSAGLAGLLIMSAALAGCSGKVTAEKVLKKVEKSMEDVTSYQMDTLVDADGNLSMSGMSFDFSISMDMKSEIWNNDSRNVNHTTGSMKVNVLGNDVHGILYRNRRRESNRVCTGIRQLVLHGR